MKPAAVIFDLDGTIILSEESWGKAFGTVLKSLGVEETDNHPQTRGVSHKKNWENLIQKYNIKTTKPVDELVTLTYVEYEKLIPMIKLNDGFWDFVDVLQEHNLPLALATQTRWETTSKILQHFDLEDIFESVTTAEEVILPKPDPDIFILAAEKIGVEREDCLVIEDSNIGVKAARRAGMKVIKIIDGFSDVKLKEIMLLF
ncbi:MAG TPA: HAD family phosphatase [Alphaproteobacteria bacterium]|jgi:HAD superfamily hydrolase (TIGR01509 family)|nr:HAD family phosphatase [Alphaproteobacteria bacterium]